MARSKPRSGEGTPAPLVGDPFQQGATRIADGAEIYATETMEAGRKVLRVQGGLRIETYRLKGSISYWMCEAGIRFGTLYRRAVLPQALTSAYGDCRGGGGGGADEAVDARRQLHRVLAETGLGRRVPVTAGPSGRAPRMLEGAKAPLILSPEAEVLIAVCGEDKWAGGTANLNLLRQGLHKLVWYFQMPVEQDDRN